MFIPLRATSVVVLFLLTVAPTTAHAFAPGGPMSMQTDGSAADVQAAIDDSRVVDGWTVLLPPGAFTWATSVSTRGKAIHLAGLGSGRIIGRSTSSVAIGAGSASFTTQAGLLVHTGDVVRIARVGNVSNFVEGPITSYSGTTLTINATTSGGSGTYRLWIISTRAATTLVHSAGASALLTVTESTTGHAELSGAQIVMGSGSGIQVLVDRATGGQPVLIHDMWFRTPAMDSIRSNTNRGVVWSCSFDSSPFSMAPLAIHLKDAPSDSWTTPSTMGAADLTGASNLYIEDCDFHAFLNATDFDDNGRVAMRHDLFNNAGFGTHGADTSTYGVRHYEVYDSEFVFNGYSDGTTFNLNWWFFLRGGTGVIADNIMPNIMSTDYGDKLEVNMIVMNLQRNAGPNACWGANMPGNQYPAPRQVGMGRISGTAGTDSVTYVGDSEPLYLWGNTGGYAAGTTDYGSSDCMSPDSTAAYVMLGRDYFNDGRMKPGYAKYTYPHPLRSGAVTPMIDAGVPLMIDAGGGIAIDAGGVAQDAGGVAQDAGGVAQDAGGVAQDAGGVAQDAGGVAQDAGGVAQDAGGVATDAGPFDAGPAHDAGVASHDAARLDSDAATLATASGGCGCRVAPRTRDEWGASVSFGVAILASVACRARRRRPAACLTAAQRRPSR